MFSDLMDRATEARMSDIKRLELLILDNPEQQIVRDQIVALMRQVESLQLMCSALMKALEVKQVVQPEELEVLMQQIDLLDGVEDGKIRKAAWEQAPRCRHCNHYVNPARDHCVYCGRVLQRAAGGPYRGGSAPEASAPPPRMATCGACQTSVPQRETLFTGKGDLVCTGCYVEE
ncbi:MAG: hypothetical protein AAGE52_35840 [Myxococcota bacterium]